MSQKTINSIKFVLVIKFIIVAAAIIFLPIGDFLMCSCFVLPPSFLTAREIRPGFNRFTALFVCNGVVGACMAAALALGIEIEGVSVSMMFITCAIYTFLFGVPLDICVAERKASQMPVVQKDDTVIEAEVIE